MMQVLAIWVGGVIVGVALNALLVGIADRFAYSMSKGAIHAMSLSIARNYLHDHIRSNTISTGRVHTPFVDGFIAKNHSSKEAEMLRKLLASQPIGRMARPEKVASVELYLRSDEAGFLPEPIILLIAALLSSTASEYLL
jgi:2-keto-3-deoxy-L-fuconate dehydrogenase